MNDMRVIWSTFKLHMSQSFSRATFRFCIIIQPLIYTFILYMMYRYSGIENYINNVILGSGICSLWSAVCFSSAGDIERERHMGTLENIFCCPSAFTTIILGKIFANTFLGLSGLVLSVLFTRVIFKGIPYISNYGMFFVSFIVMILSFVSLSLVICPIFTLSRNARTLMNCMEYPIFILGGFVFLVNLLPKVVRPLSYILAPSWSVAALRESALGITDVRIFMRKILLGVSISIVYLIIGRILFKRIDKRTRIEGTLGVS